MTNRFNYFPFLIVLSVLYVALLPQVGHSAYQNERFKLTFNGSDPDQKLVVLIDTDTSGNILEYLAFEFSGGNDFDFYFHERNDFDYYFHEGDETLDAGQDIFANLEKADYMVVTMQDTNDNGYDDWWLEANYYDGSNSYTTGAVRVYFGDSSSNDAATAVYTIVDEGTYTSLNFDAKMKQSGYSTDPDYNDVWSFFDSYYDSHNIHYQDYLLDGMINELQFPAP